MKKFTALAIVMVAAISVAGAEGLKSMQAPAFGLELSGLAVMPMPAPQAAPTPGPVIKFEYFETAEFPSKVEAQTAAYKLCDELNAKGYNVLSAALLIKSNEQGQTVYYYSLASYKNEGRVQSKSVILYEYFETAEFLTAVEAQTDAYKLCDELNKKGYVVQGAALLIKTNGQGQTVYYYSLAAYKATGQTKAVAPYEYFETAEFLTAVEAQTDAYKLCDELNKKGYVVQGAALLIKTNGQGQTVYYYSLAAYKATGN